MDNSRSKQRKVIALKIMAMYRVRMSWPGAKIESSKYLPFFTLPKTVQLSYGCTRQVAKDKYKMRKSSKRR